MKAIQKEALKKMGNAGAIRIGDQWIWREDIRCSEDIARLVLSA